MSGLPQARCNGATVVLSIMSAVILKWANTAIAAKALPAGRA